MKILGNWAASLLACATLAAGGTAMGSDVDTTINKLRTYCKACHAVGDIRFIWSENNDEVWEYIFTQRAPNSQKLWAESIVEVLSWPGGTPPSYDELMDPANNRDWMPKGSKRIRLSRDKIAGTPTREIILDEITFELERRTPGY